MKAVLIVALVYGASTMGFSATFDDAAACLAARDALRVECCRVLVMQAMMSAASLFKKPYRYAYLSARKGWATPDSPLNRPGWHCDGFGTDDLNFVWWKGPGTRFYIGPASHISEDHVYSLKQFEALGEGFPELVHTRTQGRLYMLTPGVIHATPIIESGCMRQYVKVSLSNHKYNLKDNSHNYLFDYEWEMFDRDAVRNDTDKAQRDYA